MAAIKHFSVLFILFTGLIFSSCNLNSQTDDGRIFKDIDEKTFHQMFIENASNEKFVLIDTRTDPEFQSGHLKGASLLDFNATEFNDMIAALDKSKTYLLYCRSGRRSGLTMDYMKEQGFQEVYNLDDGIISWNAAGYEVVTQ